MRAFTWMLAAVATTVAAVPVHAQQILVPMGPQHDRVRVSGFFWRAQPGGEIGLDELDDVPGLGEGIDIADTLGFAEPETGWILEGNVAAGRRHRFIVELSRLENTAERSFTVFNLVINARSDITLREFHGFYNFLFVARPEVEVGVLGGVGWFDASASINAGIARASAQLDQAFPAFGGNLLIYPKGPVRGYVELSGFPRVEIDELSGSQFDLVARAEVFVVRNFGLIVGYRRYRLVFNDAGDGIDLDLKWDGFIFGAQGRF